ncbi:MAG: DUF1122 family protein [Actinobacteria bacterium]|nr:DUF1122 family protein [Actinomycetota bacterium]
MMIDGPEAKLLKTLAGRELDGYSLEPRDFKRGRTDRESYFNLFLVRDGTFSLGPIAQGLFFIGRGDYIKAWIEFRYVPRAEFPDGTAVDLEEEGLTHELFSLLGEMIPAGGSMMVIYGAEPHPLPSDTEKGLKRAFPPAATPLGYYLWSIGLRWFKDWYFPEGWMEGGMKLQATRPLNEDVRAQREAKARGELEAFVEKMKGKPPSPLEEDARRRAEEVLASMKSGV